MIISTDEAIERLKIVPDALMTKEVELKLTSLEIMVRNLTNNKFLDKRIRVKDNCFFEANKITGLNFLNYGFRKGNTIEIVDSMLNDGLFVVTEVDNNSITVDKTFEKEAGAQVLITKIVYPYDIVEGVLRLMQYDLKMGDKIGIKQESISRYSVTYYDVNSTESIEGYPATLMKFLNKYKKLRWV